MPSEAQVAREKKSGQKEGEEKQSGDEGKVIILSKSISMFSQHINKYN